MHLMKLPLLMSMLLYHTDAETIEYERTRDFALGMDSLVQTIENQKVDQDEREKVRDVVARIESIRDQVRRSVISSLKFVCIDAPHHSDSCHLGPIVF